MDVWKHLKISSSGPWCLDKKIWTFLFALGRPEEVLHLTGKVTVGLYQRIGSSAWLMESVLKLILNGLEKHTSSFSEEVPYCPWRCVSYLYTWTVGWWLVKTRPRRSENLYTSSTLLAIHALPVRQHKEKQYQELNKWCLQISYHVNAASGLGSEHLSSLLTIRSKYRPSSPSLSPPWVFPQSPVAEPAIKPNCLLLHC
jgi:hypothetical protein